MSQGRDVSTQGASQNVLKTSDDPVLIGEYNVRLLTLAESVDHWDGPDSEGIKEEGPG